MERSLEHCIPVIHRLPRTPRKSGGDTLLTVALWLAGLFAIAVWFYLEPPRRHRYQLAAGEVVECSVSREVDSRCGMVLRGCVGPRSAMCAPWPVADLGPVRKGGAH